MPGRAKAIDLILSCPQCCERHIDDGEWVDRGHHTHACQFCGLVWRPAIEFTRGVQSLPGFLNEAVEVAIEELPKRICQEPVDPLGDEFEDVRLAITPDGELYARDGLMAYVNDGDLCVPVKGILGADCQAIRQSDEMYCVKCDLRWSFDDPVPPICGDIKNNV